LRRLPRQTDPNVLVGFETSDDAGVYLLDEKKALVQTVDFFTPIVDDPETFGAIAAANSLSDIYAMGGRPVCALSLVGFPEKGDPEVLGEILKGGHAKMAEAGCSVIGGHSVRNDDVLFGFSVTGVIDPARVWKNVGARPGDALLLSKPLGTGVISTALKHDKADPESLAAAVRSMTTLNRAAAEALAGLDAPDAIHAVTDITGFGLLGHAREMALGNPAKGIEAVSFAIDHAKCGYLPGALQAAKDGHLPGGLKNNRDFVGDCVSFSPGVAEEYRSLLFDPQTSGGLLIAVGAEHADRAVAALEQRGIRSGRIGAVLPKSSSLLQVR
jgi:selenide, water dikinase